MKLRPRSQKWKVQQPSENWASDYLAIPVARDENRSEGDDTGDTGEIRLRERRTRADYPAIIVKRQRSPEEELINRLDRLESIRRAISLRRAIKKTLSPQRGAVCHLLIQCRDVKEAQEAARMPHGQFRVVKHHVLKQVYGLLSDEQRKTIRWEPSSKKSDTR